jgi:hypothetical protein
MAGLVHPQRRKWVREELMEILWWIVTGSDYPGENVRGVKSIAERCRRSACEGLSLLYREAVGDLSAQAKELLRFLVEAKFSSIEEGNLPSPYTDKDMRSPAELGRQVELEITKVDWDEVEEESGSATGMWFMGAMRGLLTGTPEDSAQAYANLQASLKAGGNLHEAAVRIVPVVTAALVEPERPPWVRANLLELLWQIVCDEAHCPDIASGRKDMPIPCMARAKEGLWVLYRELFRETHDRAKSLIEILDDDKARLDFFEQGIARA